MPTPHHHDESFYPRVAPRRGKSVEVDETNGATLGSAPAILVTGADRLAGSEVAERAELLTLRRISAALAESCEAHGAHVGEDCFPHVEEKVRAICAPRYEQGAIKVAADAGRGAGGFRWGGAPAINEQGLDDLALRAMAVRNAGRDMRIRDAQSARLERNARR
jgi:hypothetical protein